MKCCFHEVDTLRCQDGTVVKAIGCCWCGRPERVAGEWVSDPQHGPQQPKRMVFRLPVHECPDRPEPKPEAQDVYACRFCGILEGAAPVNADQRHCSHDHQLIPPKAAKEE